MVQQKLIPFDPASDMWAKESDVDWVRGSYVCEVEHPRQLLERNPWIVSNRVFAESMVKMNAQMVFDLFDTLIAWQVCTVSQAQAGLSASPLPPFNRYEPNLYGALVRLGAINVGFDPREKLDTIEREQVWLSMGNDSKIIRNVLKLISADEWQYRQYSQNRVALARPHARHNTFASHAGLLLSRDPRVMFTSGDGYGGFRYIDKRALDESGMERLSSADVVCMGRNNVLAGIEVQASRNSVDKKMRNWVRFLAHSPMGRRGVICVWLFIKGNSSDSYPPFHSLMEHAANMPEMMVGEPTVASRIGWALWEDWFANGVPTERIGEYTDMNGTKRNMLDASWRRFTPHVRDVHSVEDWGWVTVRDQLAAEWGVDASRWTLPEEWRGGFHGFTVNNDGGSENAAE